MELVRRDRKHVDVLLSCIDLYVACRLNRISMEKYLLFPAYLSYFSDWLNSSDLVVCKHDRYKACILADRVCNLLRRYDSVLMNVKKRDLKTLLL